MGAQLERVARATMPSVAAILRRTPRRPDREETGEDPLSRTSVLNGCDPMPARPQTSG